MVAEHEDGGAVPVAAAPSAWRRALPALAAAAAVAALSAAFTFVPWLHAHGLYLRDALMLPGGERQWWRLLTAMWVHLDGRHWLGNLLAASGLLLLAGRAAGARQMLLALLVCGIAVQVALLWQPAVRWYGGLSGALHGLAVWGALRLLAADRWSRAIGVALVAGVLVKLWLEQSWLAPVRFDAAWGFGVVRAAHAAGAVAGFAWWLAQQWWGQRRAAAG
ncbi:MULTISPECIES: rhombosortase [Cupriavidus]|uniref:rhombosortase n=1 Tax=Cupriavidus TaxID=106589 RepID=UPI00351D9B01